MTPVTNNKDRRDEENNPGHEIILRSMSNEHEMAAAATTNHPKEDEEPNDDEKPFGSGRWRPGWSRSRALTAFLATAGVGAVVGTGSVIFRAASGKTSISSSKQAAVATDLLIDDDYDEIGVGACLDGADKRYAYVQFPRISSSSDPDECAANCECAQGIKGVQLRGFFITQRRGCVCFVDWLNPLQAKDQEKIAKLNDKCDAAGSVRDYYDGLLGATILLSGTTAFDCVNGDCQCAQGVSGVQYLKSEFDDATNKCYCYVRWLNPATEQEEINRLTTSCGTDYDYDVSRPDEFFNGSGKVTSTAGSNTNTVPGVCYEFKGSNKSSKATKSPKSERD